MSTRPTIETSENRPRYGHSPIFATSAARRSRMVTNTCTPRKITRPRISTARPIARTQAHKKRPTGAPPPISYRHVRQLPKPASHDLGCVSSVALQITVGSDQRLTLLERNHLAPHRCRAAVIRDRRENPLHGLDRRP